jgi:hypothetical protein
MSTESSESWVSDDEKYALIGLDVKFVGSLPERQLTPNLWALTDQTFSVPAEWREWLGSVRTDEVEGCNLFLLSKQTSASPDILDGENVALRERVWRFYVGLLISSGFAPAHRPVMITGSRRNGEIGVREHGDLEPSVPSIVCPYPAVLPGDVREAARLGEALEALGKAPIAGGHWRLFRTLRVYVDARVTLEMVDRIHQYCRCIEGLILPEPGKSRQQFKSRTELFVGPAHHQLIGEIYDIRSAVEHLHESRYLGTFDRQVRLDLTRKEAMIEHIARTALARIIGEVKVWPYFANTPSLARFWGLTRNEQRAVWGQPIDPLDALADFDPKFISDGELGAPA